MRKDAKIGFAIGAVLLAVLTVYSIVVPKHNKKSGGQVTLVTPPPAAAPSDAAPSQPVVADSQTPPAPTTNPSSAVADNNSGSSTPAVTPANPTAPSGPVADAGSAATPRVEAPTPETSMTPSADSTPSHPAARRSRSHPESHADAQSDTATGSAANDRTYTIKSGDTLSSIANEIYGNPRYWVAIQRENKALNASHLKVGEKIQLPDPSIVRPTEVVAAGNMAVDRPAGHAVVVDQPSDGHTYTVKSGDTLYKIARAELGSARLADELYDLNKDEIGSNKAHLKVGMVLKLPQTASSSAARLASSFAIP